ncbi:TRIC cation channel family protein [Chryseobacterium capnotolerans]|uniref:trimeric intracellular cation channel family protein n=1 Tax=Chryseobacterium TaxID=59732 RepID=UPI00083B7CE2|nr:MULTISPECIES: TRIC cation channel family protein [Chryseobacterium]UHO39236.1 TRIC cation channel family protein [Chryseobacterium capnotolerans]
MNGHYLLPTFFDLIAVFLFAFSGSVKAIEKGYDFIGVFIVAMVTSTGGSLIRDTLLQNGPPAPLLDYRYLLSVFLAGSIAMFWYKYSKHFSQIINIIDAISLGMYAVFGTQKAIILEFSIFSAFIIGFINAVGGGLLRDLLIKEESHFFKPGQYYAVNSIVAITIFLILGISFGIHAQTSAIIAIVIATILRFIAIKFNLQTKAVNQWSRNKENSI